MVLDHEAEHPSRWAAVSSIAAKIGCSPATLHEWVRKTEVDSGKRAGLAGLRLGGFCHRRFRSPHRRLASEQDGNAGFVLDALEQALHDRRPAHGGGLVYHLDRGVQYISVLEWVDRFNHRRILEPIGNISPAEAEEQYYAMPDAQAVAA